LHGKGAFPPHGRQQGFSEPVTADLVPGLLRQGVAPDRKAVVQTLRPRRGDGNADSDPLK